MTRLPEYYETPLTPDVWAFLYDAADPAILAETQARHERLARWWTQHVERMALADRLAARTDASLPTAEQKARMWRRVLEQLP